MSKITFSKNVTMSEIRSKVQSIFTMAASCHWSQQQIIDEVKLRIYDPLKIALPSGRLKHTAATRSYAMGVVDVYFEHHMQTLTEFCYEVNGVLYSTHKDSKRLRTSEVPAPILNTSPNGFFYKDKDVRYF